MYSGTKVFVDFFSRCLNAEYSSKGIIVQCVLPYYVATKMSRIRNPNIFAPGPTTYVRQALGTLGVESRTVGCWSHALQNWFISRVPDWLRQKLMWNVNTARRRAVLKRLREKELKDWYVKQMFLKEREGNIPSVQAMSESYFCSELLVWEKKWEEIYNKIWWLLWLLMFLVTISRRSVLFLTSSLSSRVAEEKLSKDRQ